MIVLFIMGFFNKFRRIRQLEKNLHAEIVHQEEEGHRTEEYYETIDDDVIQTNPGSCSDATWNRLTSGNSVSNIYYPSEYVVDKPRIAEPDITKRNIAKLELQDIYDNSKGLIKYFAKKALKNI